MEEQKLAQVHVLSVVVNYNGGRFLRPCIESLLATAYPAHHVLVVDNCSTDGSPQQIVDLKGIAVVVLQENLGYAAAANVGLRYAREREYQYVCLLNCDLIVDSNFLTPLVCALKERPDAAIAGPTLLSLRADRLGKDHYGHAANTLTNAHDAGFLFGAALLLDCAKIHDVGYFDEDYFLYYEETDLYARLERRKQALLRVPESRVYHYAGGTSAHLPAIACFYTARSVFIYARKQLHDHTKSARFKFVVKKLLHHFGRRGILHPIAFWNVVLGIYAGIRCRTGPRKRCLAIKASKG